MYSVSWSELDFDRLLARTEKAFDLPWIREIVGSAKRVGRILGRAYVAPDPICVARLKRSHDDPVRTVQPGITRRLALGAVGSPRAESGVKVSRRGSRVADDRA